MSYSLPRTATAAATSEDDISNYDTGLGGVNQVQNMLFKDMLWWSMGIVALMFLTVHLLEIGWSQLRHISAMSMAADRQSYWRKAQWGFLPWVKKHLTYAPIWNKRHNRELRFFGTLPTRMQSIILLGYLGSNLAYMFILDYGQSNHWALLAEMRGRSGTLAAVNMVPLTIFASRNNPLIGMLRISFDTFNLVHRWVGRTVVAEAVIHTIAWAIVQVNDGGWKSVNFRILHDPFIASGTVGTVAFVILLLVSASPLRHAFYETFLATHIILAFISLVCTWVHCATTEIAGGLPQLPWVIAIMLLWAAERLGRVILNAYYSWSCHGWPDAVVEPLYGDCCRVTIQLPRYVDIRPGTHAYLRFLDINVWECHPFSIAWVEHKPKTGGRSGGAVLPVAEKYGQLTDEEIRRSTSSLRTSVSFIVAAQKGFTRKLYNRAIANGYKETVFKSLFEGPYAGHHSLDSYGHVMLIAGASGISHQISYLRHLIEGSTKGTVATRRIVLVWVMRNQEALGWVRPWMDELLRLPNRQEILQIRLFVTRPTDAQQICSTSRTVTMSPGRPNLPALVRNEVKHQIGAMCVTVCGPGALADDTRSAVREVVDEGNVVDFMEESFTW